MTDITEDTKWVDNFPVRCPDCTNTDYFVWPATVAYAHDWFGIECKSECYACADTRRGCHFLHKDDAIAHDIDPESDDRTIIELDIPVSNTICRLEITITRPLP